MSLIPGDILIYPRESSDYFNGYSNDEPDVYWIYLGPGFHSEYGSCAQIFVSHVGLVAFVTWPGIRSMERLTSTVC